LAILIAAAARNSNAPDKLAFNDNRKTTINRDCASKAQHPKLAGDYIVLEEFGWASEQGGRSRFLDGEVNGPRHSLLHLFKIHEIAPGIDNGYCAMTGPTSPGRNYKPR